MKFFVCKHCGNIIVYMHDAGVKVVCCGEKMEQLIPGTTDAATEKHVPVIEQEGNKVIVKVGDVEHPMTEKHYIQWIILETQRGYQKVELKPTDSPRAEFLLAEGDKVVSAYEYCNLHGLWQAK